MEKKKILAIIPARGGSKGLPGKNIKKLNDKPLIAYSIEEALRSQLIDRVMVSTDSEEIAAISKQYGAEIPFIRPAELATDTASSVDVVIHAIEYLKENQNYIPEYVVLLQCTTPFKTSEDIDGTIEKCIKENMDAAVSICEAEVNPYWTVKFEGNKLKDVIPGGNAITARQLLPKAYRLNGGIYVVKTEVFLNERNFMPKHTTGYIMSQERSIDIDTADDFEQCQYWLEENTER